MLGDTILLNKSNRNFYTNSVGQPSGKENNYETKKRRTIISYDQNLIQENYG